MEAIQFFARYLYVPTLLIGLNGLAVYLVVYGYLYVWVFLLLLATIGLSFLMERVLPYEEIWNQNHDDTGKDVAHGLVYHIANLITLCAFILISSSEVYGTAEYAPMDEEHPLNPRSPYAATKARTSRPALIRAA